MHQFDARPLAFVHAIQTDALAGDLDRPPGDIHASDELELLFLQEQTKEATFAAAEIKYTLCSGLLQVFQHALEALGVCSGLGFSDLFRGRFVERGLLALGLVDQQTFERNPREGSLPLEVTGDDEVLLWASRRKRVAALSGTTGAVMDIVWLPGRFTSYSVRFSGAAALITKLRSHACISGNCFLCL